MRSLNALLISAFIAGCTSVKPPPVVEPPKAWAQTPDEIGKLPAGRILSKSIETCDATNPVPAGRNVPIMVPVNGVLIPLTAPMIQMPRMFSTHQQFYRYKVLGKGWSQSLYWDDFVAHEVGACVAFRPEMDMIVPAAPKACE